METKGIKAYVEEGTYAITVGENIPKEFFCIIKSNNEITAIVRNERIEKGEYKEVEEDNKIITFDETFNFSNPAIGFFAKITNAIASKKIRVLCYSSYYTDHIVVKEKDVQKAKEALREIGIVIE